MFDALTSFDHTYSTTLWWGLYIIPMILCIIGVAGELKERYGNEVKRRERNGDFYSPEFTVGDALGPLLLPYIPFFNFLYGYFEYLPSFFNQMMRPLSRFLNTPLVPRIPQATSGPEEKDAK